MHREEDWGLTGRFRAQWYPRGPRTARAEGQRGSAETTLGTEGPRHGRVLRGQGPSIALWLHINDELWCLHVVLVGFGVYTARHVAGLAAGHGVKAQVRRTRWAAGRSGEWPAETRAELFTRADPAVAPPIGAGPCKASRGGQTRPSRPCPLPRGG